MDWGEFGVLYKERQREALTLTATQRARGIHDARGHQAETPADCSWLTLFRHAPER